MIDFSEYISDERPGQPVFVNPNEIACIRTYAYHSFRPLIGEIVLQSGEKIRVWETVEQIHARLTRAARAAGGEG